LKKIAGLVVLMGVAACSSQTAAPTGDGLCWRRIEAGDQPPRFEVMARDVPNLESCAVQLEGARMMEGRPTSGAYNGQFIFATEDQITSARTMDGARIRVFSAEHRQEIQAGLQALIAHQNAASADNTGSPPRPGGH
jgi:hypothetical protein